jgi:hypothetical protein
MRQPWAAFSCIQRWENARPQRWKPELLAPGTVARPRERLAASKATNATAKQTHTNLADAYERRARALAATERRTDMRMTG